MKFIPLAEQTGRIDVLTWQILTTALRELNFRLRHHKDFKLSFNVTPSLLLGDGFVRQLREIVWEAGVSARQIVVEITERDELQDLDKAALTVSELRQLGFKVAIDDVGVGHSGLSHLKALGANTMKIDKFFVDSIKEDSTTRIVATLVQLAKELKMNVIAEGIETHQQVDSLRACGVLEGQGYVVAAPLPFVKFDELLQMRQAQAEAKDIIEKAALVA
jgi:EAL domain-containing protein (putative c-di-GMP-specific phosphodiesterase class I)